MMSRSRFYLGIALTLPAYNCVPLPSMYVDEFGLRDIYGSSEQNQSSRFQYSSVNTNKDPVYLLVCIIVITVVFITCAVVGYMGCELALWNRNGGDHENDPEPRDIEEGVVKTEDLEENCKNSGEESKFND